MNWSGLEHEPPAQPALGCGLVGGGDLVQRHDRVHPGWQAAGRGAGEQIGQSRTVRARYHDVHALRALTGVSIQLITGGQPPGPWPAGRRLTAGPAPGPKPLVTSPGRRAGDRLLVHGGGVPLPVEVVPAGAVGPSGSTGRAPASSLARSTTSPATGTASRSWLPRRFC